MGFNDHDHSVTIPLPPEAGDIESDSFDPNDEWIKNATEEQQIEAMRRWFYARYEDPANSMPYDGREGGFQFIWGGPYDPDEVIQERFSAVVPFDVMRSLIEDLWQECGDQWAPVDVEDFDYDEEFVSRVDDRDEPLRYLKARLNQIDAVLGSDANAREPDLVLQMAHGSMIASLEAFLADTMTYWLKADKKVLRDFVSRNKDFKKRSLTLDQVFERLDQLESEMGVYLQDQMWHRLDKIKPMLVASLGIAVPEIGDLMKAVLVRHDIVHRAGRTRDGLLVLVTQGDVKQLRELVLGFATALVEDIDKRFPRPTEEF
jgi:hypothetical protein